MAGLRSPTYIGSEHRLTLIFGSAQVDLALDVAFGTTLLGAVDESICWAVLVGEASSLLVSPLGTLFEAGSTAKAKSNESISTPK